jgi:hypothetical protein
MIPSSADPTLRSSRSRLLGACISTSLTVEAAPIACALVIETHSDGRTLGVELLGIAALATIANGARHRLAGKLGYFLLSGEWHAADASLQHGSAKLRLEDLLGRAGPALLDVAVVVTYLVVIAVQRPLFAVVAATAICVAHAVTSRIAASETAMPQVDLWSLHDPQMRSESPLRANDEPAEWEAAWSKRANWLRHLLRTRMWTDVLAETLAYGVAAAGVLPILVTPDPRSLAHGILVLKLADGLLHFVGVGVRPRQYLAWIREGLGGFTRAANR